MLPFNLTIKKLIWNLISICFILMLIACFFGDDTRASRAKIVQIKNNTLDLVVTGGETLFSFISKTRSQSPAEIVDEVKETIVEEEEAEE